jgi:protein phosphatase
MVPEDALAAILRGSSSLAEAAAELVRAANEAGGRDNVTVVLFRLGEGEEADADADATAAEGADVGATMVGGAPDTLRAEDVQAALAEREAAAAVEQPPADATMVFDEEQRASLRAAQRRPGPPPQTPRRRRLRRWVTVLVIAAVVAGVGLGFRAGSRQFYFVGTDDRGLVALYRGLPYELPFGIELWQREYSTAVPARMIPETRRDRILDHRLRGRGDAVDLIKRVERGELEG